MSARHVSHMALETRQAPQVVEKTLLENFTAIQAVAQLVKRVQPSHIITCARGSSDHAASYFKYLCEIVLGIPI